MEYAPILPLKNHFPVCEHNKQSLLEILNPQVTKRSNFYIFKGNLTVSQNKKCSDVLFVVCQDCTQVLLKNPLEFILKSSRSFFKIKPGDRLSVSSDKLLLNNFLDYFVDCILSEGIEEAIFKGNSLFGNKQNFKEKAISFLETQNCSLFGFLQSIVNIYASHVQAAEFKAYAMYIYLMLPPIQQFMSIFAVQSSSQENYIAPSTPQRLNAIKLFLDFMTFSPHQNLTIIYISLVHY
jgi:hypothetical protein